MEAVNLGETCGKLVNEDGEPFRPSKATSERLRLGVLSQGRGRLEIAVAARALKVPWLVCVNGRFKMIDEFKRRGETLPAKII